MMRIWTEISIEHVYSNQMQGEDPNCADKMGASR